MAKKGHEALFPLVNPVSLRKLSPEKQAKGIQRVAFFRISKGQLTDTDLFVATCAARQAYSRRERTSSLL